MYYLSLTPRLDTNENVNSRINLIFVGAIRPENLKNSVSRPKQVSRNYQLCISLRL